MTIVVASLFSALNPENWAKALSNEALRAVVSWVQDGARTAIGDVAQIIGTTTTPRLTSTWFSGAYWQVAGLATLLTIPFLFAAALQAMIRSDLALLGRAVFGHLPLALIGVGIASPVAMLLISATDEMSNVVSGTALGGAGHFLVDAGGAFVLRGGDPFLAFFVALLGVAAAIALMLEMLVRSAAVYIVVLMLPMAFAGLVWPARRVWAIRLVELLIALILSKFVIVAVLSLAGAAFGQSGVTGISRALTAMSLLLLSTFAPWTMLRLLPFAEIAASAGGALRQEMPQLPGLRQLAGKSGGGDSSQAASEADAAPMPPSAAVPDGPAEAVDLIGARLRTQAQDAAAAGRDTPATYDTPASPSEAAPDRGGERLPGMDRIWQAENGAWPPLRLGPDGWGGPTEYEEPPLAAPGKAGPGADATTDSDET